MGGKDGNRIDGGCIGVGERSMGIGIGGRSGLGG